MSAPRPYHILNHFVTLCLPCFYPNWSSFNLSLPPLFLQCGPSSTVAWNDQIHQLHTWTALNTPLCLNDKIQTSPGSNPILPTLIYPNSLFSTFSFWSYALIILLRGIPCSFLSFYLCKHYFSTSNTLLPGRMNNISEQH